MAPRRRSTPSSETQDPLTKHDSGAATPSSSSQNRQGKAKAKKDEMEPEAVARKASNENEKKSCPRSWYGGGTWPRKQKSTPSTQVAKESILADTTSDTSQSVVRVHSASAATPRPLSLDPGKSKSTLEAIYGEGPTLNDSVDGNGDMKDMHVSKAATADMPNEPQLPPETHSNKKSGPVDEPGPVLPGKVGWLEWLGITKTQPHSNEATESHGVISESQPAAETSSSVATRERQPQLPSAIDAGASSNPTPPDAGTIQTTPKSTSHWAGLWQYTSAKSILGYSENRGQQEALIPEPRESRSAEAQTPAIKNGSSWAFWSKVTPESTEATAAHEEAGELAVTGETSQNHPVPADTNRLNDIRKEATKESRGASPAPAVQIESLPPSSRESSSMSAAPTTRTVPENLLLPSFFNTYDMMDRPSIIQQIGRSILRSRQTPENHLFRTNNPPKIKKAIAIGIHGLFPAPLFRTVIGQPTGTSIRFANYAAAGISRWANKHGFDCEIKKVVLEGEGKIAERVERLWELLLNWTEYVQQADFILLACHSQGVPVALVLVEKLIALGVVSSAKIGVCAMAGVSLGPFPDYKSRYFSGSTAELFELADLESDVSRSYQESLHVALTYGVRVTYVGSIDDQLVSLESAIFSPVDHPYIHRSVFVDGRVHAPDFIAHLVGFVLKLRNLGVSDHGLIRTLSTPLAGSLYTGEGHSRLYDEERIYDLAIQFALETTSVEQVVPMKVAKYEPSSNSNPFQLPWSMRGLLEEDVVKTKLEREARELLLRFDEWKPTTKVLKDVKFRLEVIKSKL